MQPPIVGHSGEQVAIAACRRLVTPEPCQQRRILVEEIVACVARQQPFVVGNRLCSPADDDQRACQLREGGRKFRAQLNRRLQTDDRRVFVADLEKRAAEVAMSLRESRFERNHASVPCDRRGERAPGAFSVGEIAKGRGEARPKHKRAPAARDRGVGPSQPEQHFAQVVMRIGEPGIESDRAPEALG